MGLIDVSMEEEDKAIVEWTLTMKECKLSITIQQLKLKVVKITQIRPTPFRMVFQEALSGNGSKKAY
jgi:hypothetical protein